MVWSGTDSNAFDIQKYQALGRIGLVVLKKLVCTLMASCMSIEYRVCLTPHPL